jgi:hypothetical protein
MGATMTIAITERKLRPAPGSRTTAARRSAEWTQMSNTDLKFSLDLLSLHQSPFEADAANEIERRIMAGTWLDINQAPPTHADDVPLLFHVWPFCLMWKQRQRT